MALSEINPEDNTRANEAKVSGDGGDGDDVVDVDDNNNSNNNNNNNNYDDDDDDDDDDNVSDESSFYGDEQTRTTLERRVADSEPATYWSAHHHLHPSAIAAANIAAAGSKPSIHNPNPNPNPNPSKHPPRPLYNPYSNTPSGRQLSESTTAFLSRLPPLSTPTSKFGPWIYIANPYSSTRPLAQDLNSFSAAGTQLLASLSAEILALETSLRGQPQVLLHRKLTQLRKIATEEILRAAKEYGVTAGKWMLFVEEKKVDDVWRVVVDGTAEGRLGTSAKVATDGGGVDGRGGEGRPRLVAVYTEDFADEGDVKRVLGRLVEMGLASRGAQARGLFYKCDAFTHLGIDSNNEWGLKASLYASRDLLAADKAKGKRKKGKGKGG